MVGLSSIPELKIFNYHKSKICHYKMLHILLLTTKFNNMNLRFNNAVNTKNSTIPLKKIKIQGFIRGRTYNTNCNVLVLVLGENQNQTLRLYFNSSVLFVFYGCGTEELFDHELLQACIQT